MVWEVVMVLSEYCNRIIEFNNLCWEWIFGFLWCELGEGGVVMEFVNDGGGSMGVVVYFVEVIE